MLNIKESRALGVPSISEINQIITGNRPFAIISAYLETEHDEERSKLLEQQLSKYDYFPLLGWWYENDNIPDIPEKSFFILDISKEEAIKLGKGDFIPKEYWSKDGTAQLAILYSTPEEEYIEAINPTTKGVDRYFSRKPVDTQEFKYGYSRFITPDGKIQGRKWSLIDVGEQKPIKNDNEEPEVEEPEVEEPEVEEPEVEEPEVEEPGKNEALHKTRKEILEARRKIALRRIREITG